METKKFAIEMAVKLIASTNIEQKQKAVFDFAREIEAYIEPQNKNTLVGDYSWIKMNTLEQTE